MTTRDLRSQVRASELRRAALLLGRLGDLEGKDALTGAEQEELARVQVSLTVLRDILGRSFPRQRVEMKADPWWAR